MATKTCPSCSEDVPVAATRCKHCFHDFTEQPVKKGSTMLLMLGFLLAMAVTGAGTFAYIFHFNSQDNVVVDAETQSIVFTRTSASKTETERLTFAEVTKLEHVTGGDDSMFEVVAITTTGERYVINQSDEGPLQGYAEHISAIMDKPMEEVRTIKTFGD